MPKLTYFLLFPLLLTPLWAVQQSGSVRSGGLPIPGATITATQGEQKIVTTTDDAGQYTFNNLAAGVWKLQVEIFGFSPASREVTIDDKPSTIEWTLELKPLSGPISNAAPSLPSSPVSTAAAGNTPAPSAAKPSASPAPARTRPTRGTQAQAGDRQNQSGFQNLSLTETAEGQAMAAAATDGSRAADTIAPRGGGEPQ